MIGHGAQIPGTTLNQTIKSILFVFIIASSGVLTGGARGQPAGSQKPLAYIRNWAIETGAAKTLGRSIAGALGYTEEMPGRQIAFTGLTGEGHIALVCDLDRTRLIFLAHFNAERRGLIWLTSEDGVLQRTAVRGPSGAQSAENSQFAKDFEAEKQFFAAVLPDAARRAESNSARNAPSCRDGGAIAGSI
jgi:hypothetical protein